MEYDIIIVGAGPAGLAAAIKIKQLSLLNNANINVCILEKGAHIGAHILSGAVLDPHSLQELLPQTWQQAPLNTPVKHDNFYYLTQKYAIKLPTPKTMRNHGNYIISLENLCKFLQTEAENLNCEIYPGFAATDILYNINGEVIGVKTGNVGIDKNNEKTGHYIPGMQLYAKQTLFAEGCRGQLSENLIQRFALRKNSAPQTYALGIKEIWQIPTEQHLVGQVIHTIGWPLTTDIYGGSFIYHLSNNIVALGLVIGLDYSNPWLNPFNELQRFKTHPFISNMLKNAERIGYGAKSLNEGGWQSIPKLTFPGGALIGDAAGFLNVPKIKGIHTAIKSGMLAAQACYEQCINPENHNQPQEIHNYQENINRSYITQELYKVRNIRPGFRYGLWYGLANAFLETYITYGYSPWTLQHNIDYKQLKFAQNTKQIAYPAPDGVLTFDKPSSLYLSNTYHEEDQPAHLKLRNHDLAMTINYENYASPETRYCPAGVYELIKINNQIQLQINAQNCLHCKACDIKDPSQNIVWQAPEGGGGPNYQNM